MNNKTLKSLTLLMAGTMAASSCIGSFGLFNKVLDWNQQATGNKFLNWLIFILISPAYVLCGVADIFVINSIEFWSGNNPVACNKVVDGEDARYEIISNPEGYIVKNMDDNTEIKFNFDEVDNSWSVEANGEEYKFMKYIDDNNVEMITPDGSFEKVELSAAGVYAYQQIAAGNMYANR